VDLMRDGRWLAGNGSRCPATVSFLKSRPELCKCSLARAYFSILLAGKSISPHHGRSNVKLRLQLPLIMGMDGHCEITVPTPAPLPGQRVHHGYRHILPVELGVAWHGMARHGMA
jgi:hypothetical protein